nr:ral guanine nucleotide dissociation stimulator-like isoform X2 [Equus asinus]XP_044622408.1 ral guanine nucleotide dissociation stimulator-like isoform X2 [Equus asinus]
MTLGPQETVGGRQSSSNLPDEEATSMLTSLETGPIGAQKGLIPFLGTFLNYLLLLDTNMEDYLEGNEINYEKRSEEFKVTQQIFLLQEAVHLYHIEAEERFGAWFEAMEPLSEDESHQTPDAEPSNSGRSRSFQQLECSLLFSGGDTAGKHAGPQAGSSHADGEKNILSLFLGPLEPKREGTTPPHRPGISTPAPVYHLGRGRISFVLIVSASFEFDVKILFLFQPASHGLVLSPPVLVSRRHRLSRSSWNEEILQGLGLLYVREGRRARPLPGY